MLRFLLGLAVALCFPSAALATQNPVPVHVLATAGTPYTGTVAGVAADAYDVLSATVDWGDGSAPTAGTTACVRCDDGLALQSVDGTHTYARTGLFHVLVTVVDASAGTRFLVRSTAVVRGRVTARPRLVGPRHVRPGTHVTWRVPITLPAHARRLFTFWRLGAGTGVHAGGGGRFVKGMLATTGDHVTGVVRGPRDRRLEIHVHDDQGDSFHLALNLLLETPTASAPPRAGFRFDDFPVAGSAVGLWGDFSDPGLPEAPLSFSWDFGDGTTGGGSYTTHAYALGGRYTVRLTVSNGNGSDTITDVVTVVGKKICGGVDMNGIPAYFLACLKPFELGADGVLSYAMDSSSPMVMNGVYFRPLAAGYPIVVKPATGTVWSNETLERPLCLYGQKCTYIGASGGFTVPRPDANGESIVAEGINASLFGTIAGFALAGTATLHLYTDPNRPALYEANVILPQPFVGSGAVKEGASLADFTVKAPNASFGPLQLTDLVLTRSGGVTAASGNLVLADGPAVAASFAFSPGGALVSATADASFNPGVPIGPFAELDEFHAAYGSSPFHLVGSGTFGTTARLFGQPVVQATGCLLFGMIGPGQSLNDCAVGGSSPFTAAPATVLRVSGSASLLGRIPLGSGFVDTSTANGIFFGGTVDYSFPPGIGIAKVTGTVAGHIADPKHWQVKAGLEGCIKHVKCADVDTLVSSRGVIACASFWWGDPGGYYRWTGGWGLMMHGCDVDSTGGVAVGKAARRRVLARSTGAAFVHLTGGRRFEVIAVSGAGASPQVVLTGPGGVKAVDDGSPFQQKGRVAAIFHMDDPGTPASPDGSYVPHTTYLYVIRPRRGTWTVRTVPGSSAITTVRTAGSLPKVSVTARVRHLGGRRFLLQYTARAIRGQRVTFLEVGRRPLARTIGTTAGGRGSIAFTAALGPAGVRTIEAQVTQDGLPRAVVRVARYRAPRVVLPRPLVAARATGTALRVTWLPVRGATAYRLDLRLHDGRHLRLTVPGTRTAVSVARYGRTDSARITVAAVGGGVTGPARGVRLAARGRPAPVVI